MTIGVFTDRQRSILAGGGWRESLVPGPFLAPVPCPFWVVGVVYPGVGCLGSDRVSKGVRYQRGIYPTPPGYATSAVGTHPARMLSF